MNHLDAHFWGVAHVLLFLLTACAAIEMERIERVDWLITNNNPAYFYNFSF
jgi:hypothetical protein